MSNEFVRSIVENIVNDKFDTLKEDLSKAVSAKAVNVLESKKVMVGKKFFEKEEVNEEPIDEISKATLGNYALKAHRQSDLAKSMSKNSNDKMGKIARKRYGGTQMAIRKLSGNARVNATEK